MRNNIPEINVERISFDIAFGILKIPKESDVPCPVLKEREAHSMMWEEEKKTEKPIRKPRVWVFQSPHQKGLLGGLEVR